MTSGKPIVPVALLWVAILVSAAAGQSYSYQATRPAPGGADPATTQPSVPLKPEELEQIAAPIALYPDSLLAQVFMASTYPLEVVQADRWVKQNPKLTNSPEALNKLTWDPSVKSLINFPQVLTMMSEKLDWTVKLGDAFIADQKSVMDAVQRLRNKAYAQGNLKTNEEQKVSVQPTTAPSVQVQGQPAASPQVIVVESASPSTVYVPAYNPTVVYGGWPYPAYPPYYYPPPPSYNAGAALVSFGVGVAVGAAWGHAWGGCNWHGGDVDVDVNRNTNLNRNINREQAKTNINNRSSNRTGGTQNSFQHDPSHRQGVGYRDAGTTARYKGAGASQATAQARDSYRGRTEGGPSNMSRGGAAGANQSSAGGGARGTLNSHSMQRSPGSTGTRSSGFSGSNSSGASARAASSRGQASRSSSAYSGNRGGYSGAARSSGASRGGGGGRGGGGRR